MTTILALDTSTEACSVALSVNGEVNERFERIPRLHARKLLPMLQALMTEFSLTLDQVDALAFGCGPGSFTGLRIAASVTQGLAYGADLPVVRVSTLAAMAQHAGRRYGKPHVVPLLDARMGEIYWADYERVGTGVRLCGREQLSAKNVFQQQLCQQLDSAQSELEYVGVGPGWQLIVGDLAPAIEQRIQLIDTEILPHAGDIARLGAIDFENGKVCKPEQALPVYMRDKSAWKTRQQQLQQTVAKTNTPSVN